MKKSKPSGASTPKRVVREKTKKPARPAERAAAREPAKQRSPATRASLERTSPKPRQRQPRLISPTTARRLAILTQRLAGPRPSSDPAGILQLVRELGCLQLDPISVVARSHQIVLFSRLGSYSQSALDTLLWKDRSLFEYWAHAASIVLTEDFPFHHHMMMNYRAKEGTWEARIQDWITRNEPLRQHILEEIQRRGPMSSREFEDLSESGWESTGWNAGRNVGRMLDFLWIRGVLMVAGRSGQQKLWDLAERCLPDWTPMELPATEELVRKAAERSLRALGVARPRHISQHFIRGRYPGLRERLEELESAGRIKAVQIGEDGEVWPEQWLIHVDNLAQLDAIEAGEWHPRTTLLSPFDNLICDRARTETLFGFDFRMEIYVPKTQRKFGYYVLPLLHGDRLIARLDVALERSTARLKVHGVHAERGAPTTKQAAREVAAAIGSLASWLGAEAVDYGRLECPTAWKRELA